MNTYAANATATTNFAAATGSAQSFAIGQATTTISIDNIPANAVSGGSFTPTYAYSGYGTTSTTSSTSTCKVTGVAVNFVGTGTCTLTAHATAGANYAAVDGNAQSFTIVATVQIMVGTNPSGRSFTVDSTTYTSTQTFTWNVGSSHTLATTSPQAGTAGTQYVFCNWSDAGAISHSVTAPSTATTYTANFTTQYQLTTQASPSADGSVTPASGSFFAAGASIPVTATANASFQFSNWTSTGGTFDSTTSASTNFHMPSAPATVTGNFATRPDFTISASPLSQTISSGHSATFTITLTSLGGLTGSVALSCSGAPPHSTCTVSPSTVKLNGTVKTTAELMASQHVNHGTFTLIFTGTLGSVTHSTSVSLKVK